MPWRSVQYGWMSPLCSVIASTIEPALLLPWRHREKMHSGWKWRQLCKSAIIFKTMFSILIFHKWMAFLQCMPILWRICFFWEFMASQRNFNIQLYSIVFSINQSWQSSITKRLGGSNILVSPTILTINNTWNRSNVN